VDLRRLSLSRASPTPARLEQGPIHRAFDELLLAWYQAQRRAWQVLITALSEDSGRERAAEAANALASYGRRAGLALAARCLAREAVVGCAAAPLPALAAATADYPSSVGAFGDWRSPMLTRHRWRVRAANSSADWCATSRAGRAASPAWAEAAPRVVARVCSRTETTGVVAAARTDCNPEIFARFWPVTRGAGPSTLPTRKKRFTPRLRSQPSEPDPGSCRRREVSECNRRADRPGGVRDPEVAALRLPAGPASERPFFKSIDAQRLD